jgi:hypothetical protein
MKNERLILSVFAIFIFSLDTYANLAQVTKVHGHVTYLSPGMREAKELVKDQWLINDTSVLSTDKSFAILTYKDGSSLTLGPSSKIIVDQSANKEQKIVSLLIGKMKAAIKNEKKTDDNKVIIKTTTAALGIRGTEFQTSYNPESKITSLLTFHGAVAMAKINPRDVDGEHKIEKIEEALKNKSVEVTTGEYSGVAENIKLATSPVKIAPEQFTKLKLNESLGASEEVVNPDEFKKELAKTVEDYARAPKKVETVGDHLNLKSGGFVDIDTGLYLAPPKDSELDPKLNIYKTNDKMGKIDDAGNYQPPVGLKIDAKRGFVVDQKSASLEVLELAKNLNESIKVQMPTPKTEIIKKKNDLKNTDDDIYKKFYDPDKI